MHMIFVGSGALLRHAVYYAQSVGLEVRAVSCPPGEHLPGALHQSGIKIVQNGNPDADLARVLKFAKGETVVSINNRHLFSDKLLASDASFFNIHNGLVQRYRGAAEACVFAALCRDEEEYGVTLHRILPGQRVDCGPVVEQRVFDILPQDGFGEVMDLALRCCRQIFERNVLALAQGAFQSRAVEVAATAVSYDQLAKLYAAAGADVRRRAARLGKYRPYFPRLHSLVATTAKPTRGYHNATVAKA
ncbi:hypothetical protein XarjCFBP1022_00140 [Xanthomonas arboricola]|nr:hypothetical protein XarjCFBP1022_00140 [Xanthomonas arboricola]